MNDGASLLITGSAYIAGKPRTYRKGTLKKFLPFCAKRDVILYQYKTNP